MGAKMISCTEGIVRTYENDILHDTVITINNPDLVEYIKTILNELLSYLALRTRIESQKTLIEAIQKLVQPKHLHDSAAEKKIQAERDTNILEDIKKIRDRGNIFTRQFFSEKEDKVINMLTQIRNAFKKGQAVVFVTNPKTNQKELKTVTEREFQIAQLKSQLAWLIATKNTKTDYDRMRDACINYVNKYESFVKENTPQDNNEKKSYLGPDTAPASPTITPFIKRIAAQKKEHAENEKMQRLQGIRVLTKDQLLNEVTKYSEALKTTINYLSTKDQENTNSNLLSSNPNTLYQNTSNCSSLEMSLLSTPTI